MSKFTFILFTIWTILSIARVPSVSTEQVSGPSERTAEPIETEQQILRLLSNNPSYGRIRPNKTTNVKVNIYVRDAQMKTGSKISYDLYYPWTVDLLLRQSWNDPRLAYESQFHYNSTNNRVNSPPRYFPLNTPKSIWKPDLFFPEADKGDFHYVATPNTLLWLYPNGDVLYSLRMTLSLSCRQLTMPRHFGHGIGIPVPCPLTLSSFGYTSDQLNLEWEEKDPLEVNENLFLQNTSNYCLLDKATTNGTSQVHTRTGNFSIISSEFLFLC